MTAAEPTVAEEIQAAAEKLRTATFHGAMTATPAVAALCRAREPLSRWLDANVHPGWQEAVSEHPLAVARAINGTQTDRTSR